MIQHALPSLGFGLGLRPSHYDYIDKHHPNVDWFEIISENYMDTDGRPKRRLAEIKERYPIVMHGVSLSIGTIDPLNSDYLKQLKRLMDWVNPAWVSDHLCWTGVAHRNVHDLLPVPYTEESLKHIVERIKQVQDYLERPMAFENPSTYLEFNSSSMPEAEFIARMVEESGCWLLLDVNNVYVSCYNHRLDPKSYIDSMPLDRVVQVHLAGHENYDTHIVDTHNRPVIDEVWSLYRYLLSQCDHRPNTMIEWDDDIPEFPVLYAELEKARSQRDAVNHPLILPQFNSRNINRPCAIATPLVDEQQWLQHSIVSGNADELELQKRIKSKTHFLPSDQLLVYINAYRYRLFDVVYEDYPVMHHYLGAKPFERLLWQYIQATQSSHYNIARFSLGFPSFILTQLPEDRFAFELSQLEATLLSLFDAPESEVLSSESLTQVTEAVLLTATLVTRKALSCLIFTYAVNDYYQGVMDNLSPAPPVELRSTRVVVFRDEDILWRLEMDSLEFSVFERLRQGQPLGEALTCLLSDQTSEDPNDLVSGWFARWMNAHLFTSLAIA